MGKPSIKNIFFHTITQMMEMIMMIKMRLQRLTIIVRIFCHIVLNIMSDSFVTVHSIPEPNPTAHCWIRASLAFLRISWGRNETAVYIFVEIVVEIVVTCFKGSSGEDGMIAPLGSQILRRIFRDNKQQKWKIIWTNFSITNPIHPVTADELFYDHEWIILGFFTSTPTSLLCIFLHL